MPPQLILYQGRSLVIDPDVFAMKDPRPIFDFDLKGASIGVIFGFSRPVMPPG